MSNLVVSTLVDTFMESANLAAAQETLGIAPGLPMWTFAAADSSDPAAGKFTTDNASKAGTTFLYLSLVPKNGGDASFIQYLGGQLGGIILLDSTGETDSAEVSSATLTASGIQLVSGFSGAGNWSGDYSASFYPINTNMIMRILLLNSLITPCPDGTVTPVTSITTVQGIITAIS